MENILLPSKISFEKGEKANQANLVMEPCFQGYGTTVGNALRRVLLSSLPGAAVISFKIKGAPHEFTSIDGVAEDVLELSLNLKMLRLKLFSDEPVRLTIKASGETEVTGADVEKNALVEIVNPDLHLLSLTSKDSNLEMEIVVSRGRGYSAVEDRDTKSKNEIGMIQIDALYSPLKNVGYSVENARVGDITNYDKLVMTIDTDGTISPEEAVREASKILIDYFSLLAPLGAPAPIDSIEPATGSEEEKPKKKKKSESEE
ncbi:MAG: DNA-directed RNA polymerase subunit alpha [bacterium]